MCTSESTHRAVETLDMQRYRFGLLVGGVDKELGFCFLLPLRYTLHRLGRCIQDVEDLLCQGCDVNSQARPKNARLVMCCLFQSIWRDRNFHPVLMLFP